MGVQMRVYETYDSLVVPVFLNAIMKLPSE